MAHSEARLRRLITDEVGQCCDSDVEERLSALTELDERTPSGRADDDVRVLRALANGTRYRIVRLLVAADDELCVCEFDPLLDVSESAISHALSDLTDSGLVSRRKDGKWRYYRVTERAERLLGVLDDTRGENDE